MKCSEPGAIHDEELVAYLAGEAVRPVVVEHLMHCQRCSLQLARYRRLDLELLNKLYRWDCPPNQLLGEYQMGMLPQGQLLAVKNHLLTCALCTAEVAMLTQFLQNDPMLAQPVIQGVASPAPTNHQQSAQNVKRTLDQLREQLPGKEVIEHARRIAATLLPQQPRIAYQRTVGSQAALWPRRYEAEDVMISVQVERDAKRKDTVQLIGFVSQKGTTVDALQGSAVQLLQEGASKETIFTQTIDDLGNFVFSALTPGSYTLELHLTVGNVFIDQLSIVVQE